MSILVLFSFQYPRPYCLFLSLVVSDFNLKSPPLLFGCRLPPFDHSIEFEESIWILMRFQNVIWFIQTTDMSFVLTRKLWLSPRAPVLMTRRKKEKSFFSWTRQLNCESRVMIGRKNRSGERNDLEDVKLNCERFSRRKMDWVGMRELREGVVNRKERSGRKKWWLLVKLNDPRYS